MKNLLITSIWLGLFATSTAHAISVSGINGVEGAEMCKHQIATLSGQSELRFQRQSASSFRGSNFKYWINADTKIGDNSSAIRFRCEISRTGEVIEIIEENGRWNI